MKSKPDIIPVQLTDTAQNQSQCEPKSISPEPTCQLKSGDLEITLHNGIHRYMQH